MIAGLILFFLALNISKQTFKTCYDHETVKLLKKKHLVSKKFKEKPSKISHHITEFDWRRKHFISPIKNQNLPVSCGSCWAHSAASTITDRFYIAKTANAGSCVTAGAAALVFQYAIINGLSDDTCNSYTATDKDCTSLSECSTCISGDMTENIEEMMYQISKFGPISCSMYASHAFFYNYTEGVYKEKSDKNPNHEISLIGWGWEIDKDGYELPYWIGRNSWGTFWGEGGFFKMPRSSYKDGEYTLGIENNCFYPIL